MKDTRNITITLLGVTAAILTAMLVTAYVNTNGTALADTPARGGQYIAVMGAWSEGSDLLYLTDVVTGQMNVYTIDKNKKSIEPAQAPVDLEKLFR